MHFTDFLNILPPAPKPTPICDWPQLLLSFALRALILHSSSRDTPHLFVCSNTENSYSSAWLFRSCQKAASKNRVRSEHILQLSSGFLHSWAPLPFPSPSHICTFWCSVSETAFRCSLRKQEKQLFHNGFTLSGPGTNTAPHPWIFTLEGWRLPALHQQHSWAGQHGAQGMTADNGTENGAHKSPAEQAGQGRQFSFPKKSRNSDSELYLSSVSSQVGLGTGRDPHLPEQQQGIAEVTAQLICRGVSSSHKAPCPALRQLCGLSRGHQPWVGGMSWRQQKRAAQLINPYPHYDTCPSWNRGF